MARVQFSVTGYQEAIKSLDPNIAERAVRAALKRTLDRTRTKFTQSVAGSKGRYTLPAAEVRDKMTVRIPGGGFEGVLHVSGARLNVAKFKHRQTGAGLVVEILKHGGKRLIASVFLPKKKSGSPVLFNGQELAFIRKRADRRNPFHQSPDSRESSGVDKKGQKRRFRFPLAAVRSLSVPKMVTTEKFHDRQYYGQFILQRFAYEFEHALIGLHALRQKRASRAPE